MQKAWSVVWKVAMIEKKNTNLETLISTFKMERPVVQPSEWKKDILQSIFAIVKDQRL